MTLSDRTFNLFCARSRRPSPARGSALSSVLDNAWLFSLTLRIRAKRRGQLRGGGACAGRPWRLADGRAGQWRGGCAPGWIAPWYTRAGIDVARRRIRGGGKS